MKIRSNYVSNSSSSSFIVEKDLTSKGLPCLQLTEEQKKRINGSKFLGEIIELDLTKNYWLTPYIYDGNDRYDETIKTANAIEYDNGEMSETPYNDIYYNKYVIDGDISIFIKKEDDEAVQMKFSKFVKMIEKDYGSDIQVVVDYKQNCIELRFVEK